MPRGGKRKNAGRKKLKEPRNIYKRLTFKENQLIEEMRNNPLFIINDENKLIINQYTNSLTRYSYQMVINKEEILTREVLKNLSLEHLVNLSKLIDCEIGKRFKI